MKALVIDSSPINRERIVSLLMGVNNIGIISQAEDKETAERMIEELQSEFVVLNTYIHQEWGPRTNSISLLKKIKRRNPSTIVVMSEDLPHTPDQNDYLTLGAEFFIDPSHNLDRWAKTIEGLLQG